MNFKENIKLLIPSMLLYFLHVFVLSHMMFAANDPGYIYGMAHRILLGESMYIDFINARPPLSPYLAAFWLWVTPDDMQYYYTRVANITVTYIVAILTFSIIKRHFDDFISSINSGLLILVIFLFNANYMGHFWHTVDGINLSVLALYILLTKKQPSTERIFLGSFVVVLAMLTKQSFYPLPFAIFIFFYFMYSKHIAIKFFISMSLVLFIGYLLTYGLFYEQLNAFLAIKQYQSQLAPFVEAGFLYYFMYYFILIGVLGSIYFAINFKAVISFMKKREYKKLYSHFNENFVLYFMVLYVVLLMQTSVIAMENDKHELLHHAPLFGALMYSVVWLIIDIQQNRKNKKYYYKNFVFLLLLSIAWMGSLSWGYKTPILYSGSIIVTLLYIYYKESEKQIDTWFYYALLISFLMLILVVVGQGFKVPPTNLGKYSKKLEGTYVFNDEILKQFIFIENQIQKCYDNGIKEYVVIPSHPHIDWIHDKKPQLSLDWVSNVEMLNQKGRLESELLEVPCVIVDRYYNFWEHDLFGLELDYLRDKEIKSDAIYIRGNDARDKPQGRNSGV